MMKILSLTALALAALPAMSQQQAGKIVYERTIQLQIRVADNEGMDNMMPRSRTDKFELSFGNNQTLWKQVEPDDQEPDLSFSNRGPEGGGVQIRMMGPGSDDIMYSNIETSRRVELKELGTKKFIVEDSIRRMDWKLSDETKTLLGHLCRKAITQRIGTRMMVSMDNGKMERKPITDTSTIVAWFTPDIPVSAGPAEFQGQLPGAILEIDINNGKSSYKAIEITQKVDIATIKEPKGPKKITPQEFNKERDKMFEEMGRNAGGPGRTIRIN